MYNWWCPDPKPVTDMVIESLIRMGTASTEAAAMEAWSSKCWWSGCFSFTTEECLESSFDIVVVVVVVLVDYNEWET